MQTKTHRRYTSRQILVFLILFAYVLINVFPSRNLNSVYLFNTLLTPALTLTIVIQLALIIFFIKSKSLTNKVWLAMLIGWGLWTIAEVWWASAILRQEELPYPSGADILWMIGYIPMFYALILRYRSIPNKISDSQRLVIWGTIFTITVLVLFFVFAPLLQSFDPSVVFENILDILYPLTDLILLVLVLRIFFTLQGGLNGRAWLWLSIAFITLSISDLLFSYATIHHLYYPNNQANVLSVLFIDIPYNLSYTFVVIGLYHMRMMNRSYTPITVSETLLKQIPNCRIVVFVDRWQSISEVSDNCEELFDQSRIISTPVMQLFDFDETEKSRIVDSLHQRHVVSEFDTVIRAKRGSLRARVSAVPMFEPDGEFSGEIFLIRTVCQNADPESKLTEYQRDIANSIMQKTGGARAEEMDTKENLKVKYLPQFSLLYNLALSEGGSLMADAFLADLRAAGREKGWDIGLRVNNMLNFSSIPVAELQKALPYLLELAIKFASDFSDETTVKAEIAKISIN